MVWLQDSKTTLLDGRPAVEKNIQWQDFEIYCQIHHLWQTWETLHCGPTPLLFLLLVEELSGRSAVKVCEGMSGQMDLVPVRDVVVHVRRQKPWVSVVDVCYHFPVWFLSPLPGLTFLDPSQRLLVRSPLVGGKDWRGSHQRFHLLGCRHCLRLPPIVIVCPSLSNPWSLFMFLPCRRFLSQLVQMSFEPEDTCSHRTGPGPSLVGSVGRRDQPGDSHQNVFSVLVLLAARDEKRLLATMMHRCGDLCFYQMTLFN